MEDLVFLALRPGVIAAGLATGAVAATILGFAFWLVLDLLHVDSAPSTAILLAVLAALWVGGLAAGRLAPVAGRFHGSVTGLALAGLISIAALRGGSPARLWQVLVLFALGIALGSWGGWVGNRHRRRDV